MYLFSTGHSQPSSLLCSTTLQVSSRHWHPRERLHPCVCVSFRPRPSFHFRGLLQGRELTSCRECYVLNLSQVYKQTLENKITKEFSGAMKKLLLQMLDHARRTQRTPSEIQKAKPPPPKKLPPKSGVVYPELEADPHHFPDHGLAFNEGIQDQMMMRQQVEEQQRQQMEALHRMNIEDPVGEAQAQSVPSKETS